MHLILNTNRISLYKSSSQKARVLTEGWVSEEVYCPNCGNMSLEKYSNNQPAADFSCKNCREDFELKSKRNSIGTKIVDGAYGVMLDRLVDAHNPNLFLLTYDLNSYQVLNFFVIPKYFFIPQLIEKRKPLSVGAKRAGWVGCNILLNRIPEAGRIFLIKNKKIRPKEEVLSLWQKTLFLRQERNTDAKGWLLDIMNCVDVFGNEEFTLSQVYAFEETLRMKYPQNQHIKDKIRQQLQFLRNRGYLEFIRRGTYRLKSHDKKM